MPSLPFTQALPVCIADLDSHHATVSPTTLTETVVALFESRPDLPGVIVLDGDRPTHLVTRLKLFERLGHRYGVELFLRKPLAELSQVLHLPACIMPGYLRIDDAVRQALQRPAADLYDPIVVETQPGKFQILEMTLLLTAQSHTVTFLSNAVNSMAKIDQMLASENDPNAITRQIFQVLGQVIPHHQAAFIVTKAEKTTLVTSNGAKNLNQDAGMQILRNPIYRLMVRQGEAIYIPDTRKTPHWQSMDALLGSPIAWLGVPIFYGKETLGALSIVRHTPTPFDMTEKETAQAFTRRLARLISHQDKKDPALRASLPHSEPAPAIKINVSL